MYSESNATNGLVLWLVGCEMRYLSFSTPICAASRSRSVDRCITLYILILDNQKYTSHINLYEHLTSRTSSVRITISASTEELIHEVKARGPVLAWAAGALVDI